MTVFVAIMSPVTKLNLFNLPYLLTYISIKRVINNSNRVNHKYNVRGKILTFEYTQHN